MQTFVVLLRAVNVSGKNIIKMAELRSALISAGFEQVSTYIQSGNIILRSNSKKQQVRDAIKELIDHQFGVKTEAFVLTLTELETALRYHPFDSSCEPNKVFVTFLSDIPGEDLLENLKKADHGAEAFEVNNKVLYFHVPDGMAKAKMNNNYFEQKLKVVATGRNLNTVRKLIELAK